MKELRDRIDAKVIFSLCIFLVSILYLYLGRYLVVGVMKRPGVGFLPRVTGVLLAFFSFLELAKAFLSSGNRAKIGINWKKTALFFLGVVIYALIIRYTHYIIASIALLLFLTKLFGAKSWIWPVVFSVLLTLGIYYLFAVVFMVRLP